MCSMVYSISSAAVQANLSQCDTQGMFDKGHGCCLYFRGFGTFGRCANALLGRAIAEVQLVWFKPDHFFLTLGLLCITYTRPRHTHTAHKLTGDMPHVETCKTAANSVIESLPSLPILPTITPTMFHSSSV